MKKGLLALFLLLVAAGLAFCALLRCDNKYTAALPGEWGRNVLQENPEEVAFLVDGWEYYPGELLGPEDFAAGREASFYTYAGEYANFSAQLGSPYGTATYRLVLENTGEPAELAFYLPELLSAGRVYIGGALAGEQGCVAPYEPLVTDRVYAFFAEEETEIIVQCANFTHYYSGMYYPPAIGTPSAIARMISARMAVYGLLCFAPLAVALSNLALWLTRRDKLTWRMGLLCLSFSARVCYPFLRALGAPAIRPLYALEDLCGALVLLFAFLLAGELSGAVGRWFHRFLAVPAAAGLCAATVIFPLFILPHAPLFINLYGVILFFWELLAGLYLFFLALCSLREQEILGRFLLCSAGLFGLFAVLSALTVNIFEPIRGAWPEEYGGFLLTAGFAALMVRRALLLAQENNRLTLHLQEEVDRRTQALETLLSERRELLGNLIHDLKNPLSAVHSYAELVRAGGIALDQETAGYLDALADRVGAMEERFGVLQSFSRGEREVLRPQPLLLNDFLRHFFEDNRPDMELSGQTFSLRLPLEPLTVSADPERLRTALENLCYNALSFTPEDGTISLSLAQEGGSAVLTVRDDGSGIDPGDLPHVFERGFTRRAESGGEGLGLFLVRTVALEHGGDVRVTSEPGQGSAFSLVLPLFSAKNPPSSPAL